MSSERCSCATLDGQGTMAGGSAMRQTVDVVGTRHSIASAGSIAMLLALLIAGPVGAQITGRALAPDLRVEWSAEEDRRGRTAVSGYVYNERAGPYATGTRLRVDALDGAAPAGGLLRRGEAPARGSPRRVRADGRLDDRLRPRRRAPIKSLLLRGQGSRQGRRIPGDGAVGYLARLRRGWRMTMRVRLLLACLGMLSLGLPASAHAAPPLDDPYLAGYAGAVLEREFKVSPRAVTAAHGVLTIDATQIDAAARDN